VRRTWTLARALLGRGGAALRPPKSLVEHVSKELSTSAKNGPRCRPFKVDRTLQPPQSFPLPRDRGCAETEDAVSAAKSAGHAALQDVGGHVFSASLVVSALVGPRAGRTVDAVGGRELLAASNVILAAGLAVLAFAQSQATLWLAWLMLGLGMGIKGTVPRAMVRMPLPAPCSTVNTPEAVPAPNAWQCSAPKTTATGWGCSARRPVS
jgi:hypothetical protein